MGQEREGCKGEACCMYVDCIVNYMLLQLLDSFPISFPLFPSLHLRALLVRNPANEKRIVLVDVSAGMLRAESHVHS